MKKVKLDTLKQGDNFKYCGTLYIVTDEDSTVRLTGKDRGMITYFNGYTKIIPVIPVKIETMEVK